MPDNLNLPLDTDIIEQPGPNERKITQWWADALENYRVVLEGVVEIVAGLSPGLFSSYVTDGISTTDGGGVLSGGTTALVVPTATPNEGDLWTAFLTQPAAGNELITIPAGVRLMTANDLDRRPNKVTVVSFKARADGDWWMTSLLMGR